MCIRDRLYYAIAVANGGRFLLDRERHALFSGSAAPSVSWVTPQETAGLPAIIELPLLEPTPAVGGNTAAEAGRPATQFYQLYSGLSSTRSASSRGSSPRYNPLETKTFKYLKEEGRKVFNGLDMFIYQGQKSFYLWNKINPEIDDKLIELLNLKLK